MPDAKAYRNVLLAGVSAAFLVGCQNASIFDDQEKAFQDIDRDAEEVIAPEVRRFARKSSRTKKNLDKDMLVHAEGGEIPSEILEQRISYRYLGALTYNEFAGLLQDELGVRFAVPSDARAAASPETGADDESGSGAVSPSAGGIGGLKLPTDSFNGCFGEFLNLSNRVHGLAFDYGQGTLFADRQATYTVSLPQDEELLKSVKSKLEALGAQEIVASTQSAQLTYSVHPRVNRQRIVPYLKQLRENLAMVTIQAALVNVRVTKNHERGLDWNNTSISIASQDDVSRLNSNQSGSNNNTNNNPNNTPTTTPTTGNNEDSRVSAAIQRGVGAAAEAGLSALTGEGVIEVGDDLVGIATAFAWLEDLGRTRTSQSLELSTIAGSEVKLRSGTTEPFVSEVGIGNVGSSNNNTGTNVGTVNTETVETGLEVTFGTNYDRQSKLVTVSVDLDLSILQEFKELSAGNQFGTISQPVTQDREFEDKLRMKVGDTAVIGGLRDVTMENSSRGPEFTAPPLRREAQDSRQDALFIVLRPVVTEYHLSNGDKLNRLLEPRYQCEAGDQE